MNVNANCAAWRGTLRNTTEKFTRSISTDTSKSSALKASGSSTNSNDNVPVRSPSSVSVTRSLIKDSHEIDPT